MESCWPAIIVSFGVTAHCGPHGLQCSRNRFRGRVSWRSYDFHDSKHFARSLVAQAFLPVFFRGWAMTILNFSMVRGAVVRPNARHDEGNLGLLGIFTCGGTD
jgi:hypothetical protein